MNLSEDIPAPKTPSSGVSVFSAVSDSAFWVLLFAHAPMKRIATNAVIDEIHENDFVIFSENF
jgi:hypothetical protein